MRRGRHQGTRDASASTSIFSQSSVYSKQLQKRQFDFDVDCLRPYFETEQVRLIAEHKRRHRRQRDPPAEKPALLPRRDAFMLSDCELQMQSGTMVNRDFVELHSQLNENWVWESEALGTYARHYKTRKPLPKDLLRKRLATRFFFPATGANYRRCILSNGDSKPAM